MAARYLHTNLIAADWRSLSAFYQQLFGCVPVPPERDLHGDALEAGTGLSGAHLRGVHLRLPGGDATLEIFQYTQLEPRPPTAVNRPGYEHIAFAVDDMEGCRAAVLAAGGRALGDIVTTGGITWCYVTNPEGNVIELQSDGERGIRTPG